MRFSAAAVALFAGIAVARPGGDIETVYQTDEVTITSCAPTVTDCPGNTATQPASEPAVPTGTSPVTEEPEVPTSSVAVPSETPVAPEQPESEVPEQPTQPAQPSVPVVPSQPAQVPSVSTSVIPVTTCIPTVTYSTVTVTPTGGPGAGPTSSKPVIPGVPTDVAPTGI
ncbi:GPI anchored serine-rich protein [Aspergillus undulatus]|uniref:GPI anchored serine-rich protein n=1 Tax=Aspergillus undulatus TaxID=1810928 RepID=UPI003CCC9FB6